MSNDVQVLVGVEGGKVIVTMRDNGSGQVLGGDFDAQNAYTTGVAIAKAAMELHRGSASASDTIFLAGEVTDARKKVTAEQRMALVLKASHDIRSMLDQGMKPGRIAAEIVDSVLAETAR